ncbi:MAG: SDR family NAD(P)-dependent oxidoreductase [Conexivisphaerales archaeon]
MRVLVTGGSGFLGLRLCKKLAESGYEVVILDLKPPDRNITSSLLSHNDVSYVQGDIRDEKTVDDASSECEATVHLAAVANVETCQENPKFAFDVNVEGTRVVLDCARWNYHKKFIFASSAAVYGEQKRFPISESSRMSPRSIYGVTKAAAELLILSYSFTYSFNSTILRFFNIYGYQPNPSYAGVVARFIQAALRNDNLTIYGTGSQTRDFVYIDDAVNAILRSLDSPKEGIFNVASGKETSISKLADIIQETAGRKMRVIFKPRRESDITRSLADIRKISKELGWRPKYTIEQGLKETFQFYSSQYSKSKTS